MAANRWAALLFCSLLPALPACLTGRANRPEVQAEGTATDGPSEFAAIYPRGPGERVPKQERIATSPTRAEVRPADPPLPVPPALETPKIDPPADPSDTIPPALPVDPTPPDPPLVGVIRAYLSDDPKKALEYFQGLDKANQDLLLRLVPAVVQASQKNLGQASPTEVGVLVSQLDEAAAALTPKASLYIEKACFCEEVKNFGRYTPLPDGYAFRPRSMVLIYTEVRNVPSERATAPGEGEGFVTRLACSLELRDSAGAVIEMTDRKRNQVPKIQELKEDFTRSRLKDYFIMLWFETPSRPGTYTVTFEVRDPKTGRAVSKPMAFRVQ